MKSFFMFTAFLLPISIEGTRITSGYCNENHCNISCLIEGMLKILSRESSSV
jgi:hypothetical protein